MNEGVLEQVGHPEEVYRRAQTAFVADFVAASNRLPARIAGVTGTGRYTVVIDGVGERLASGPEGWAAGAQTVLIIRPEELRLEPNASAAEGIAARVVDVAFLGAQRTVRLDSPQIGALVATSGAGADPPRPGDEVAIQWDDRHSWAVALCVGALASSAHTHQRPPPPDPAPSPDPPAPTDLKRSSPTRGFANRGHHLR